MDPTDGTYKEFGGPNIEAPSRALAHQYCQNNGLGYCLVGMEIVCEIPTKKDGLTPDFSKRIDYDTIQSN
jgi:hypothetical protein